MKQGINRGAILLLVVCIVAIIGYFSVTGFFVKTVEESTADSLIKYSTMWLNTEEGQLKFPNGIADKPIPTYIENTTEIIYWHVPIKNNEGLYIGILFTDKIEFDMPYSVMNFKEPRNFIFFVSRDDAYAQMIEENTDYSAAQISEPRIVMIDGGISWLSEVTENGQIIDELYVRTWSY